MPKHESSFEGTLEPYMVINENFIYVPGWDERTPKIKKITIYDIYICRDVRMRAALGFWRPPACITRYYYNHQLSLIS